MTSLIKSFYWCQSCSLLSFSSFRRKGALLHKTVVCCQTKCCTEQSLYSVLVYSLVSTFYDIMQICYSIAWGQLRCFDWLVFHGDVAVLLDQSAESFMMILLGCETPRCDCQTLYSLTRGVSRFAFAGRVFLWKAMEISKNRRNSNMDRLHTM